MDEQTVNAALVVLDRFDKLCPIDRHTILDAILGRAFQLESRNPVVEEERLRLLRLAWDAVQGLDQIGGE